MHDGIIGELAQIGALRVISRTSAMQYKDSQKSIPEIAHELDVNGLITGTVFYKQSRVQISVRLIEAKTDQNIWTESYERDIHDVLSLQSEIAQDIARQAQITIGLEEIGRFNQASSITPDAYHAYLKGQYYLGKDRTDKKNLKKSLEYFREALDIDPTYAPAYAAIADCYFELDFWGFIERSEAHSLIEAAALKAIKLDDGLAEAHTAMAIVLFTYEWNWIAAEKELKRALELSPNSASTYWEYGQQLILMRRFEEAVAIKERMVELDPLNGWYHANLGWTYTMAGQYEKAINHLQNSKELFPDNVYIHVDLALAHAMKEQYEKAVIEADKALVDSTTLTSPEISILGWVYAEAGRRETTVKLLKWAKKLEQDGALAALYAALGEKEKSLDFLESAYKQHSPIIPYLNLLKTWIFESMRGEQRYQDLLSHLPSPERDLSQK
jgi:tetratricopeptide (TPR) repeat protein